MKNEVKEDKKVKKEKQPKTIKQIIISRIIFIFIVLILVCVVTYLAITQKRNGTEITNETNKNTNIQNDIKAEEVSKYKTIDVNGIYYSNPIDVQEIQFEDDRVNTGKVKSYEIDGLKDKTVEEKINNKIKEEQRKLIAEAIEELKIKNPTLLNTYVFLQGNFANLISIEIMADVSVDGGFDGKSHFAKWLNYNLIDGEELKITDVFKSKKSATQFMLKTLYNKMAEDYVTYDEKRNDLIQDKNSKYIEEDMYALISKMQRDEYIDFGISPSKIYIRDEVNYYYLEIPFQDYADIIIIYDRFSTNKDLYDGTYDKVGPFMTMTTENFCKYKIFENKENCYIDMSYLKFENNIPEKRIEETINYMNKIVSEFKDTAKQDTNHFYVLCASYYDTGDNATNNAYVFGTRYELETTKIKFENTILPESLKYRREDNYEDIMGGFTCLSWIDNETVMKEDNIKFDDDNNAIAFGEVNPWLTND